jgi:1-acyl-sn-glycerol-3-phosphate acyltransferase
VTAAMLNGLYSLYFWLVIAVGTPLVAVPAIVLTAIDPEVGFRFVRAASALVLRLVGMPVTLRGADRVDWSRAYVVMGNHQSAIDPFAILGAFPRRPLCLEKIELQRAPVYGALSRAWGNIPIRREDHDHALAGVDAARAKLTEGFCIGVMPEGTRTRTGHVGPFKKGGFHLALGAGADILPFTINGAFGRLPRRGWRVRPGPIEIVFGEVVPTRGYSRETLDELVARVRGVVLSHYTGPRDGEAPDASSDVARGGR